MNYIDRLPGKEQGNTNNHTSRNGDETIACQNGAHDVCCSAVVGGTGKFKDMRGSGTYKGKTTPKGSQVNWEVTIEN